MGGATGYRIYRATENTGRADFELLTDVAAAASAYVDDGVDEIAGKNPPDANTSDLTMSPVRIARDNLSLVNFGRSEVGDAPVDGSNVSIDYYLGRKDVIYATTGEVKRLEGPPTDRPKLPLVPDGTLGLGSIDCPPNSVQMRVVNFGLTRVTMGRQHEIIQDVEDPQVQRRPVPDEQRAPEPGSPAQERHLLGRFLERRPVGHPPRRLVRAHRPGAPARQSRPCRHRARGGPLRQPRAVQGNPST